MMEVKTSAAFEIMRKLDSENKLILGLVVSKRSYAKGEVSGRGRPDELEECVDLRSHKRGGEYS